MQFRTLHFFVLYEFKHLGKLEAIETAITTIAGYKGCFRLIIQSLSALIRRGWQAEFSRQYRPASVHGHCR